jgi:hypothetical protein
MWNKIKNMFSSNCKESLKDLEDAVRTLVIENELLKERLVDKQEQINKTNSYYKKKIYNMKNKDKKPKKEN